MGGDQHALKCKAAACDSDGCQPRKKSIKGLFRYAATLATDSPATANAQVTSSASSGLVNFRTAAQGGSYVQIIGATAGVGGGTASTPVSVDDGALEWTAQTTLTVPGLSGTAANHKGADSGTQAVPVDMGSTSMVLYQIHDLDADSPAHMTI